MKTLQPQAPQVAARTDTRASSLVVVIVMVSVLCGAFAIDSESRDPNAPREVAVAAAE
jgi:hypothetical protein